MANDPAAAASHEQQQLYKLRLAAGGKRKRKRGDVDNTVIKREREIPGLVCN